MRDGGRLRVIGERRRDEPADRLLFHGVCGEQPHGEVAGALRIAGSGRELRQERAPLGHFVFAEQAPGELPVGGRGERGRRAAFVKMPRGKSRGEQHDGSGDFPAAPMRRGGRRRAGFKRGDVAQQFVRAAIAPRHVILASARDCSAVVVTLRAGVRFAGFGQSRVVRNWCVWSA